MRVRAKAFCIQFKTRQGNFQSARKEVVLTRSSMIFLCLHLFIVCVQGIVIRIFVCCNILFCIAVKDKEMKYLFL